jgi:hypothetical protein
MWSSRFLWTGLSSGVAVAALALGGLWLALFVVSGSKEPTWTLANIVKFALPGLIVYPACWYMVILRSRNYSLRRTMVLVVASFGVVSIAVAAFFAIGGLYVAITTLLAGGQSWKIAPLVALGPLAYALLAAFGAIILIVPYMMVATPMALAHRWLLLKLFAGAGPATPSTRSGFAGGLKAASIGALAIVATGIGWLLWQIHLPHWILTSIWPVETYYSVHAEIELDGQTYTLEGVGRCNWQWVILPQLAELTNQPSFKVTYNGGFLTLVLADGRAVVMLAGRHCDVAGSPGISDRKGLSPVEIDLITGDIRSAEGKRHVPYYVQAELPAVAVLDDARQPKSIRYDQAPKLHTASACASLRIRSYRITVTGRGEITRREADVAYLANLTGLESWVGYTARVVPFSALERIPQLKEFLEQPPPPFTSFANVEAVRHWRTWQRDLDVRHLPAREIVWDRVNFSMTLPPTFVGNCPDVVTLYPVTKGAAPLSYRGLTIESGEAKISQRRIPRDGLAVDGPDRMLFSVQEYHRDFRPEMFGSTD